VGVTIKGRASAICCTLGRDHLIHEAVKCFVDQTYEDKELIVLNDHAGYPMRIDNSKYPNVKVFNYDTRFETLGDKRNAGVNLCSGEFVFIWEDDDISTPWRMEESIRFLTDYPEYDGVKNSRVIYSLNDEFCGIPDTGYYEPTVCYRKEFLDKHEYCKENVTMDLHMEQFAKLYVLDPSPFFWYVYRWGLGVWHISGRGADNSKENYDEFLRHARIPNELITTIEPRYNTDLWTNCTNYLSTELSDQDFQAWKEVISKFL